MILKIYVEKYNQIHLQDKYYSFISFQKFKRMIFGNFNFFVIELIYVSIYIYDEKADSACVNPPFAVVSCLIRSCLLNS